MSKFADDDHDDDRGRDALVHALLQEEFGRAPQQELGDRVLARFAAGEGRAPLARVRAAAGEPPAVVSGGSKHWTLLVAAAALLAVGGVLYESWTRRDRVGHHHGTTTPRPVTEPQRQDPQPGQKPQPSYDANNATPRPGPNPPNASLAIESLANLRANLSKVTRVTLEVLTLPDPDLPFRVEVAGAPNTFTDKMQRRLLDDLRDATKRVEPAGAEWQNKLVLWLDNGERFELSVDPYGRSARTTLHTSGMNGDLLVGIDGSEVLADAMAGAVHIACLRHQIALDADALRRYAAFDDPGSFDSLRLFRVGGNDLALLQRFSKLRRLDLSGMARGLSGDELRLLVRHCAQLEELVLDGMPFADEHLHALADMVNLRTLSLRYAKLFTGSGFSGLNAGAKRRAGPLVVDLTGVTTLTDEGLREVARHDPETLRLGHARGAITRRGAMTLLDTNRLRTLDLTGWPTDGDWAAFTAALVQREGLEVIR